MFALPPAFCSCQLGKYERALARSRGGGCEFKKFLGIGVTYWFERGMTFTGRGSVEALLVGRGVVGGEFESC